jgi:hypothetical protein
LKKALTDYSGEFLPDLDLKDFSHETLVQLLAAYAKLHMGMDGFWYMSVMERHGNEEALACDMRAWDMMIRYEVKKLTETLNIRGNDPIALMKMMQVSPLFQHMKFTADIENKNKVVMTVTYCLTLDALEKEGKGRQQTTCGIVEPKLMQLYASLFNPKMCAKNLTPLPRQNKDFVCCKWLFEVES